VHCPWTTTRRLRVWVCWQCLQVEYTGFLLVFNRANKEIYKNNINNKIKQMKQIKNYRKILKHKRKIRPVGD
jgi:hypothetical protein